MCGYRGEQIKGEIFDVIAEFPRVASTVLVLDPAGDREPLTEVMRFGPARRISADRLRGSGSFAPVRGIRRAETCMRSTVPGGRTSRTSRR
jgi:hypothetical protein